MLAILALAYLVVAVFCPIVGFEFVNLDTYDQVVDNPLIRGLSPRHLYAIFTTRSIASYYPIRTLSYAIDYQLWGLWPGGFKLTNAVIHLANALLVFAFVLRLFRREADEHRTEWDVFSAAFGAGLFAIHPLVVEPVTWVPGREELLMTLGTLGTLHFHLLARTVEERGGSRGRSLVCRVAATLCCAAACLSNAVGAVIPLLAVAVDRLAPRPPSWRHTLLATSGLWLWAGLAIVLKANDPEGDVFPLEGGPLSAERLRLALSVYWLNLETLFWPTRLGLAYGLVLPKSFIAPKVVLGGAAILLTAALVWLLRRRKSILLGVVWFLLALAPASHLFPGHLHRADRYLYLPLAGLALSAALGVRALGRVARGRGAILATVAAGMGLMLVLQRLSSTQVQVWQTSRSVWEHCVEVVSDSSMAHLFLANDHTKAKRYAEALPHYEEALRLDPFNYEVMNQYSLFLLQREPRQPDDLPRAVTLSQQACRTTRWQEPHYLRTFAMACATLAAELYDGHRFAEAIAYNDQAIQADGANVEILLSQAHMLATCRDQTLRRPEDAVDLASRARQLSESRLPRAQGALGEALASAGRFDEAARAAQLAAQQADRIGQRAVAARFRELADAYRRRIPPEPSP